MGAMIPFDSNSPDPVQKFLARHEEALGEMWAFSGWLRKVTEEHFGRIQQALLDEQAFARRMGLAFENLRENWQLWSKNGMIGFKSILRCIKNGWNLSKKIW